jgi:hypothetical protein
MKIIHQSGFTTDELLTYRPTIYRNILESAQAIVKAMHVLGLECVDPANRVCLVVSPFTHRKLMYMCGLGLVSRRQDSDLSGGNGTIVSPLPGDCNSYTRALGRSYHKPDYGASERVLSHGQRYLVSTQEILFH